MRVEPNTYTFTTGICPTQIDTTGIGFGKTDETFGKNDTIKQGIRGSLAQLDNGRTDSLIGYIRNTGIANNVIRDTMLSANGMTSDDAILALIYERPSFDKDDLAHLLKLNSPHSNVVWKEIQRLAGEFNADSLELLTQYQDSTSPRKPVIDDIAYLRHELAINYGELFYWLPLDSSLTLERLIDSLETETDVQLKLLLADFYVADSQYTEASNIYDSLPVYDQDLKKYVQLKKHTLTFAENAWTWFDLIGEGQGTEYLDSITDIAYADSSLAAFQAQVILELVGVDTVLRIYEEKTGSSKWGGEGVPEKVKTTSDLPPTIKIYPNPSQNEVIVEYDSGDEVDSKPIISFFDFMGREHYKGTINGTKNRVDISKLPNGVYLYSIMLEGVVIHTGKLIVIK